MWYSVKEPGYVSTDLVKNIHRESHITVNLKQHKYFYCSAIIEHTNQVIFLEDDDVASIKNGSLSIHRVRRSIDESTTREVVILKTEIQEIMKGTVYNFGTTICHFICEVGWYMYS